MEEWKEYRLSDILSIVSGFAYKGEYLGKGEALLLGMGCVSHSELFLEKGVRSYAGEYPERYSVEAGNIVLATRQQSDNLPILGMPAIVPQKFKGKRMVFGANLYKVVPKSDEFSIDYIYWLLKTPAYIRHIRSCQTGTTVRMITKANIEDYIFICPCKDKRNRISKLLWDIEMKIELNRRINDNLEQQAQALFKSWFVDFEPFKDGEFVDDDFGRRPYEWSVKPLEHLVEKVKSGDWGKDEQIGNYTKRTFCMRGADFPDIKEGSKGKMPVRYILEKNFKEKYLCDGNVVVEISGGSPTQSTGRIVLVDKTFIADCDNALICTNFCKSLEIKEGFSVFFFLLWQYLYDKKVMFVYENGSNGLKNLNINSLIERELFVIPPKDVISRFNLAVAPLLSKKQTNGVEVARLASLRDTLLPKLMSGELNVNTITE